MYLKNELRTLYKLCFQIEDGVLTDFVKFPETLSPAMVTPTCRQNEPRAISILSTWNPAIRTGTVRPPKFVLRVSNSTSLQCITLGAVIHDHHTRGAHHTVRNMAVPPRMVHDKMFSQCVYTCADIVHSDLICRYPRSSLSPIVSYQIVRYRSFFICEVKSVLQTARPCVRFYSFINQNGPNTQQSGLKIGIQDIQYCRAIEIHTQIF